jgi:hypothetical protein
MLNPQAIARLERVLRNGGYVEQTLASNVIMRACQESAIDARLCAETVVSLLESQAVTAGRNAGGQGDVADDCGRKNLLVALISCHRCQTVSFEQVQKLIFTLILEEIDSPTASSAGDSSFMCSLINQGVKFADGGECGILAAIAEAHPSRAVRQCAAEAVSQIKPSLVSRWQQTLTDTVTPRVAKLRAVKDALFAYSDSDMAAQALFNYVRGEQIKTNDEGFLSILKLAADDRHDTLRLAACLAILVDVQADLPLWQSALHTVAQTAVCAEGNGRSVYEAVQILNLVRSERPDCQRLIEEAVTQDNEAFINKFTSDVSKNSQPRLYTDGEGSCLTVNC